MTHHVAHTNKMISDLKEQYQDRISQLQQRISEQQHEILQLQEHIKLVSKDRYYDC
jgi:CII-binding regulator of phage lambda lysogenization HflD